MRYFRNPFTLLIHIALVIIVAGALVTHFFGIQGKVTLTEGAEPVSSFDKSCGPGDGSFPFCLSLDSTEILCYPGTSAPMDFRSHIEVDGKPYTVSMNRIATFDGWRFYQSGMGEKSYSLSVSHDPWGIGITYSGYTLLLVGMAGFFMQRRSLWRSYLRKRLAMGALILWIFPPAGIQARELPTMQRPLAADFGKIYVYWNDRVCPM